MSLSTVVKIAIALLIAFFAIEKLRVHRADQRLRSPVGTTQQQPFADSPVQTATRDAPFVRLTVDRAQTLLPTDRGEALAAIVEEVVGGAS